MTVREKLKQLGLELPAPFPSPSGVPLPILGSLERELGDLERIVAWRRALGMVNAAPGFTGLPSVINGFSELILELFGRERGAHARSAVGMAELPYGAPVEIEAEVEISS